MTAKNYFSQEEDAQIKRLYRQGVKMAEIAQRVGRTHNSVRLRVMKLRDSGRWLLPKAGPSPYSPADDAIIRAGYREGRPVQQIAEELGRKRTGVIQRAMTLQITHARTRGRVERVKKAQAKPAPTPAPTPAPVKKVGPIGEQRRIVRAQQASHLQQRPTIPIGVSLPMVDGPPFRPRTCQWIKGQPSANDACKCGAPVEEGRPYCLPHLERSIQRVTTKPRAFQEFRFY